MRNIPLEVVFSFPLPNYTDPVTRGDALIIVNAIFISIVVIVVSLRFYTRIFIKKWLGSDDYLIALSLIATIGLTTTVILGNQRYAWNRHVWDVPPALFPPAGKIAFTSKIVFTAAATFTRMSLLCFYHRLNKDSGIRWFRWIIHGAMALIVTIGVVFVALVIWQCNPIEAYWVFPPTGVCMDEGTVTLGAGVINCFADLLVTVLPIPLIMRLQMPLRQRIGVAILLSLGLVVTIAGIVRTYYIWKSLISTYDETWYSYPLYIAAAVEIDLGVICASIPSLRPLMTRFLIPHASRLSHDISEKLADLLPASLRASFSRPSSRRATPTPRTSSAKASRSTQSSGASAAKKKQMKMQITKRTDFELTRWGDETEEAVEEVTQHGGGGVAQPHLGDAHPRLGESKDTKTVNVRVREVEVEVDPTENALAFGAAFGGRSTSPALLGLSASAFRADAARSTTATPTSIDEIQQAYETSFGFGTRPASMAATAATGAWDVERGEGGGGGGYVGMGMGMGMGGRTRTEVRAGRGWGVG